LLLAGWDDWASYRYDPMGLASISAGGHRFKCCSMADGDMGSSISQRMDGGVKMNSDSDIKSDLRK